MGQDYWSNVTRSRVSRRQALALTGAGAFGAAFLAACGGTSSNSGSQQKVDVNSLVVQPVDTFKQAKRGGVLKEQTTGDSPSLDVVNPVAGGAGTASASRLYSTLVRQKPGYMKPSGGDLVPDIAESWEFSPDRLQITLKLRQGVKFHNKPPVNGRLLDADDVLAAWKRYSAKAAQRDFVVNAVNPSAPVLSLTATDPKTIVIKLKEPLVYALEFFGSFGTYPGNILLTPKETDSTFDIRADAIGTGPFFLSNYTPSVGWTMKRHPDYFDPEFTMVDGIDLPIITEYATGLAQFKAGNIHHYDVHAEDLLSVKREDPRLQIYSTGMTVIDIDTMTFGQLPAGNAPFLDERARQAVSMSWDRDLWNEVFYNISKFEAAGVPMESRWSTALMAEWDEWWLDPKGKDFGPNAKYYQHDIAEAKKLLSAAGYPNGLAVNSHYPVTGYSDHARYNVVVDGMAADAGFKVAVQHADYATDYIPHYRDGQGQYDGWSYHSVSGNTLRLISPVAAIAASFWSKGGVTFYGFSTSGKNDKSGDPKLDGMIEKARLEADVESRRAQVYDIQRYVGKAMYGMYFPGAATGFTMAWPGLSNFRTYQIANWPMAGTWGTYRLWLDDTKAPFVKT